MSEYPTPAQEVRCEMTVANSRFITTLAPVFSVEQAKAFVERIRHEFADASHNVPVYLVGHGASETAHCSDDGEPSGTAGRPALAVLRGSGLGDVAVVITRYFGGTKLGTGGLVRAYSDAVRQAVEAAPRAYKVKVHVLMFELPYSLLERARLLVRHHGGEMIDETFATQVILTARFPVEYTPAFQGALSNLSSGAVKAEIVEETEHLSPIIQLPGDSSKQK